MPTRTDILRAIDDLVEEARAHCLWFVRPDWHPTTDAERTRTLREIQAHGDRRLFCRAAELTTWLSQSSSVASASS